MNKNQPDILIAVAMLIMLLALQILIGAGFYDAGVVFKYGDPRSSIILVISTGIVITAAMSFTGLNYSELFHASDKSIKSTVLMLFTPVFLVVLGSVWWFVDLMGFLISFMPEDKETIDMLERMMSGGVVSVISICLIAPFLEEMLFRGIILRGFLSHYPPSKAIILSAFLFGLYHLNIYQMFVTFWMGCFLGWLYYYSRSLWPVIFAHAVYNGGVYIRAINHDWKLNSVVMNIMMLLVSIGGLFILVRIFNVTLSLRNRFNDSIK
ncbi:hypothetical protein VST7929_03080 [Vibrio stylophorae]|uniref:CAAX prenyl protease 2/Lysostaphin resistance protein A-like domain-containing protein n=1 Tax=Vibrio stylophorae TaxID=659351 RepID=A0ABM8ZXM9_9VIBR|nr:type II CAAX endopeptidase family protein [Vibrio stylophorae]CAH0535510.1 hypothetical protein VST7929_03080 [Vibrio stylophorae]